MRVTHNGFTYNIYFTHRKIEGKHWSHVTACHIEKAAEGYWQEFGANAACGLKDNFNRAVGRKLAFTRAIQDFPAADRAVLWAEYWKRHRLPSRRYPKGIAAS